MIKKEKLDVLYKKMSSELNKEMVFGDGNPESGILFLGEAPGGDEIRLGKPFVGKAGKNLDSFMNSINIDRTKCYVSNAVKFRPTKISPSGNTVNATPTWNDVQTFRPYLIEEIAIIKPKLIVTMGGIPAKSIFNKENTFMGTIHGKLQHVDEFNCDVLCLYHPASVIYNQNLLSTYNMDLEILKNILKEIS